MLVLAIAWLALVSDTRAEPPDRGAKCGTLIVRCRGVVYSCYARSAPVGRVRISLLDADSSVVSQLGSDSLGVTVFPCLPIRRYRIRVDEWRVPEYGRDPEGVGGHPENGEAVVTDGDTVAAQVRVVWYDYPQIKGLYR